jgi:hypothetical protein
MCPSTRVRQHRTLSLGRFEGRASGPPDRVLKRHRKDNPCVTCDSSNRRREPPDKFGVPRRPADCVASDRSAQRLCPGSCAQQK